MKLLLINTLYAPNSVGGAERSVQFLAEALVGRGHQVTVVSLAPNAARKIDWINGVKVYYLRLRNVYWPFRERENPKLLKPFWHALDTYNLFAVSDLARIITIEAPDLVHTNNLMGFSARVLPMLKQRGLRVVHTLRDYYLLCPRGGMFRNLRNCETQCLACQPYVWLRRRWSNCVDAVVGNSNFILRRHLDLGYFQHASIRRVIFNANTAPPPMREDPPVGKPLRIGYFGRLHLTKGLELLLETVGRMPRGSCELIIAGKGTQEYEANLHRRYSHAPTRYLGFVRPETFFPLVDLIVAPALWHEPLSRTIIEASAFGVPAVVADRGGMGELVHPETTGFIFEPNQVDSLFILLKSLIADSSRLREMRSHCRQAALRFQPEVISGQYLALYEELTAQAQFSTGAAQV